MSCHSCLPSQQGPYLLLTAGHAVFGFFGFLNGFQHLHCVQLLLCGDGAVQAHLQWAPVSLVTLGLGLGVPQKQSAYLRSPVPELGQNLGPVVWDDAHGISGEAELLQARQSPNIFDFLELGSSKEICG